MFHRNVNKRAREVRKVRSDDSVPRLTLTWLTVMSDRITHSAYKLTVLSDRTTVLAPCSVVRPNNTIYRYMIICATTLSVRSKFELCYEKKRIKE